MREFDKRFEEYLGPAASRALSEWAAAMGLGLAVSRLFVNGRSSATVMAVYERVEGEGVRKVVLKHDAVPESELGSGEFVRQREALAAAGGFRPHLARLVHEPIRVGDGSWITFQEFADDGVEKAHVLTTLLAATPGVHLPGIRTGEVLADSTTLAAACSMLVGRMLADWSRTPEIERLPVSEFLRRHLADRVQSGKALAELARRWPGRTIRLQGEAVDLPNPFALVFDPSPHIDIDVTAIVGKGHGDLHTENVIVSRGGKDFWLIDLARYRPDAPLTQDPVQLELAIVNRILGGLRLEDREILLRVLSGPTLSGLDTLPEWLAALIGGIRDTCHSWIARSHLGEEWQAATALSAVACALIFAARPTTSLDNRVWFLRLAARSAAVFADASVPDGFVADPRPSAIGPSVLADDGGLAKLCSAYRDLVGQLISDRSARVDSLAARARHGVDIREELGRLAREWRVRLDGSRGAGLAGLAGQATVADIFGCPLGTSPCTRSEARQPGGPLPFCHVANEPMTRLTGAT